eukprot:4698495-Prymnesium_polylepis.1
MMRRRLRSLMPSLMLRVRRCYAMGSQCAVRRCTWIMEAAIAELELLGHTSEPLKEQPPSHRL